MTRPWPYGMPLTLARSRSPPGVPDSGTGMTRSASTGCSRRQPAADLDPGGVHAAAGDRGVRAGQVDVLEQAALGLGLGERCDDRSPCSSIAMSSPGSTSRTNAAPTMSSAAVSLATTQPRSSRPSTSGRMPCGSRAAYSVVLVHEDQRERAAQLRQHLERRVLEGAVRVGGEQRGDQLGVGRARSAGVRRASVELGRCSPARARSTSSSRSPVLVRLPLWPSAIEPVGGGAERRLGVLPDAGAGRRVAACGRWRGGPCSDAERAPRRRPARPGPCPCRPGSASRC